MRSLTEININAGNTVGDLAGTPIDASGLFAASVVAVITTAGTGTLTLQASNDLVATTWVNIPAASVSTTGAGTYIIGKTDLVYQWIRVNYAHTSGTGTLTATVKASGF